MREREDRAGDVLDHGRLAHGKQTGHMMIRRFTMREALSDKALLGNALVTPPLSAWRRLLGQQAADSWATWKVFLIASRGEPLTDDERAMFAAFTGERLPPTEPCREMAFLIGRRGGKDGAIAVLATYLSACCDYPELAKGERGTCLIIAPSREQASVLLGRISGVFESSALLAGRITGRTADTISLDNNVDISVRAASFRRLRGLTCIAVLCSESAYWLNENSSNPDSEILQAVRPALITTQGPLVQLSQPYARRGELWNAYDKYFGKDGPALIVQGRSIDFNPLIPQADIDAAYEHDPAAAAAEYGGEFRDDVAAFISREAVLRCVTGNCAEIGPRHNVTYYGFCDPSGGSGSDSMCLAISHKDDDTDHIVIDSLREARPKFSPDTVVGEFAADLRRYGVSTISGDHYAGAWPVESFARHRITYEHCPLNTSDLYRELIPPLNCQTIELLDEPRSLGQLLALMRSTGRGKDRIEHPRGGHDDLACVIAGAAYTAGTQASRRGQFSVGICNPWGGPITYGRERKNILAAANGQCIGTIRADGSVRRNPDPRSVTGFYKV
jgi:hypothetical protein